MGGWGATALVGLAALVALAGCEVVFPPQGGPTDAEVPTIDASDPPPPEDGGPPPPTDAPWQMPPDSFVCGYECLGPFAVNGLAACTGMQFDYCQTATLDAIDPYDICQCGPIALPHLIVFETQPGVATVVFVGYTNGDYRLRVNGAGCYPEAESCAAPNDACPGADIVVFDDVAVIAAASTFELWDPTCANTLHASFFRP